LLGLFIYTVLLLVVMPLLLLWSAKFAKYCLEHKLGWFGFASDKTLAPGIERD